MIYILFSIFCSVTVSVLLKLAKRYNIDVLQAILWNYLAALLLGFFFFKPELNTLITIPSSLIMSIGVLLPVLFLILSASVRYIGIVKSDIAQRLSLFIPIVAAVFIFGESFNTLKNIGLIVGFVAIFLTLFRKTIVKTENYNYFYPILVFVGFGLIDVLFKQLAIYTISPYTSALMQVFAVSFLVTLLIAIYNFVINKQKLQLINFICGIILGCFNFGNILFYMMAHRALADNPSTVFAAMNMGVIIFGSIIGVFLFKEQISKVNYLGVLLALISILLITLSQANAF